MKTELRRPAMLVALVLATSCADQAPATSNGSSSRGGELEQYTARAPNWQSPQSRYSGRVVESTVRFLDDRLRGDLPQQYRQGSWGSMNGPVAYHDYGTFRNEFFYIDGSNETLFTADPSLATIFQPTSGAQTRDRAGRILAEARLLSIDEYNGAPAGQATIEEFHYDRDGRLRFYARSVIRGDTKVAELFARGDKERDYYRVYPALADR